jgi:hypothetical protein
VETAKVGRPAWERRDGFVREHHRDDSDLVQQDEIPARVGLEQHRMDLQNLPDIFERMMARQLVYIHRARRRDVALSCCPARECHRQLQGVREWQILVWAATPGFATRAGGADPAGATPGFATGGGAFADVAAGAVALLAGRGAGVVTAGAEAAGAGRAATGCVAAAGRGGFDFAAAVFTFSASAAASCAANPKKCFRTSSA